MVETFAVFVLITFLVPLALGTAFGLVLVWVAVADRMAKKAAVASAYELKAG